MADFCGNCGTQLRAGAKFCQSCGAAMRQPAPPSSTASLPPTLPISTGPPTPSAAPYGSGYEPMAYALPSVPVPSERPKSRGVLKAVLITLAIFMVLIVGSGVGLVYFVSKKANEFRERARKGEPLPIPGIGGVNISKGEVTEEALGLPIYQPSTPSEGSVSIQAGNNQGRGALVVGEFTTDDEPSEVADFYREKMHENEGFVEKRNGRKGEVVFVIENPNGVKTVTIKPQGEGGKTKFVITSIGGVGPGGSLPPGNVPHPPPPPAPPAQPGAPQ
jgi:hypothetical protein